MLRIKFRTKLDRDSWTEVFMNEDMYISNVLYFEIFRIENSGFENIKEVVITYDKKDYDVEYVKKYIPKKIGYKIRFLDEIEK